MIFNEIKLYYRFCGLNYLLFVFIKQTSTIKFVRCNLIGLTSEREGLLVVLVLVFSFFLPGQFLSFSCHV